MLAVSVGCAQIAVEALLFLRGRLKVYRRQTTRCLHASYRPISLKQAGAA